MALPNTASINESPILGKLIPWNLVNLSHLYFSFIRTLVNRATGLSNNGKPGGFKGSPIPALMGSYIFPWHRYYPTQKSFEKMPSYFSLVILLNLDKRLSTQKLLFRYCIRLSENESLSNHLTKITKLHILFLLFRGRFCKKKVANCESYFFAFILFSSHSTKSR